MQTFFLNTGKMLNVKVGSKAQEGGEGFFDDFYYL